MSGTEEGAAAKLPDRLRYQLQLFLVKHPVENEDPTTKRFFSDVRELYYLSGGIDGPAYGLFMVLEIAKNYPKFDKDRFYAWEEDQSDFRDQFHLKSAAGNIRGVYDYKIREYLLKKQPMFILGRVPYLYEGGVYSPDLDGTKLKNQIESLIYPEFIKSTTTRRIYDLFFSEADLLATAEELNDYPPEWINFKNGFYDPIHRKMVDHHPKYKAVNQIPHEFHPDQEPEGETVKAWLEFIADDPEDVQMLLEYAGYCMTRDTRQQKFLILNGEGGSGKSTVIRMIEAVIGESNISNISLNQLTQRFSSYGLLGKLMNSCADLEVSALEDTSTLKKILGEDRISAEAKGKQAISFRSYAKLIFSTNELPIVRAEKTNGFYRRLLIMTMNKQPSKSRPDFFQALSAEIDYFIHQCVEALEVMYRRGSITESAGSVEAVEQLRCDSDVVAAFLRDCTVLDKKGRIKRQDLYDAFVNYCEDADRTRLKKNNFYKSMQSKGFSPVAIHGYYYYRGVNLGVIDFTQNYTQFTPRGEKLDEIPFA